MRKNIILLFLLIGYLSFSQTASRANRFFEKGDFLSAAKNYQLILTKNKNKTSKEVLIGLANSYYNLYYYHKAAINYKRLLEGRFIDKNKTVDSDFNFKYAQVLFAMGYYEQGVKSLKKYNDANGIAFNVEEAIQEVEDLKLKTNDYKIYKTKINTRFSEFGAVKHKNDVFFVSNRGKNNLFSKKDKWTHNSFLDIFSVNQKKEKKGKPVFKKEYNTKLHDGSFCFSKDGNTIFISRSNFENGKRKFDENGVNHIQLYKSVKKDSVWGVFQKLSFNTEDASYEHPSLSKDGKKIYYSSNRSGGFGSYDIYFSKIYDDGSFSAPINMGKNINTKQKEQFPHMSNKGDLFFSSNGHLGLGMLDVFASEYKDGVFLKPVNLGSPLNSRHDDFSINYFDKGQGYVASNRNKTDDIFKFKQIGEIFVKEYLNTIEIKDKKSKKYIADLEVELFNDKDSLIYVNKLDSVSKFTRNLLTGNYKMFLKKEKQYKRKELSFKVDETPNKKLVFYLEEIAKPVKKVNNKKIALEQITNNPDMIKLLKDKKGPKVVVKKSKVFFEIPPIYFEFDKWKLTEESKNVLRELAMKLEKYPEIHLKISSHTDSRGTERYNQFLSEKRAEATRNFLALEVFINARRFNFKGYGESQPIENCTESTCTEEIHSKNRRSEFEIIHF